MIYHAPESWSYAQHVISNICALLSVAFIRLCNTSSSYVKLVPSPHISQSDIACDIGTALSDFSFLNALYKYSLCTYRMYIQTTSMEIKSVNSLLYQH